MKPNIRIHSLDLVRGTAILLAMGWHFNQSITGNVILDTILLPGRIFGWAGVDLFFVLSGFLIGSVTFKSIEAGKIFNPALFLQRRAFRLWPVAWCFLAAQVAISYH